MHGNYIIGVSQYNVKRANDYSIVQLSAKLIDEALKDASRSLSREHLQGLLSMYPGTNLSDADLMVSPHSYATELSDKLHLHRPANKPFVCKTGYAGGCTPVSLCLQANDLISRQCADCIAVLVAQKPQAVSRATYASRIAQRYKQQLKEIDIDLDKVADQSKFPAIPMLYGAYTDGFLEQYGAKYGIDRKHLAMLACLMQRNAFYHPESLSYQKQHALQLTAEEIMKRGDIGVRNIRQMECARLADGGFCAIIASKAFILKHRIDIRRCFKIVGSAECQQTKKHRVHLDDYKLEQFAYHRAIQQCLRKCDINTANIRNEIQWFGLYDCFPVVLMHGLLATGISRLEDVANFIEKWYDDKERIEPINTHGGLLAFGAPLSVPSGYCIVESVRQLRNEAHRQIPLEWKKVSKPKALIASNGGILTYAAAMVIEKASSLSKL